MLSAGRGCILSMMLACLGVENDFIPWLMESVNDQLQKSQISRQVLDAMIREVVQSRKEQFLQLEAEEEALHAAATAAADAETIKDEDQPKTDAEPVTKEDDDVNKEV